MRGGGEGEQPIKVKREKKYFQDPLWLLFAHGQSIWNISDDGKNLQLQRADLEKVAMLDFDYKVFNLFFKYLHRFFQSNEA